MISFKTSFDGFNETYKSCFKYRLVFFSLIFLFIMKIAYGIAYLKTQGGLMMHFLSFVQDAGILIILTFIFQNIIQFKVSLKKYFDAMFYIVFLYAYILDLLYTPYVIDFMNFPINIFAVSGTSTKFFAEYFLSLKLILIVSLGLAIPFTFAKFIRKNFVRFMPLVIFIILSVFVFTISGPSFNPIVYSVKNEIAGLHNKNLKSQVERLKFPETSENVKGDYRFLNKHETKKVHLNSKYEKIIVLVMESINKSDFKNELGNMESNFKDAFEGNCEEYTNYHTLNLDSYTSLIAMLNSVFVPYQAYISQNRYEFVNEGSNLVKTFNENGYATFFMTSYGSNQLPFVPDTKDWTELYVRNNVEDDKFVCTSSSKVETACEDFSIFNELMNRIKSNKRAFIYQELVYGHTSEWISKKGEGTIEYYNRYFSSLINELKKEKLLDKTLLVVLSDHGPRFDATELTNYEIPMVMCANDIKKHEESNFYSHLDFANIIFHKINNKINITKTKEIYTVGNSGEWIYGMIKSDGEYIFINNRQLSVYSNEKESKISKFNKDFQNYLNYFQNLRESFLVGRVANNSE